MPACAALTTSVSVPWQLVRSNVPQQRIPRRAEAVRCRAHAQADVVQQADDGGERRRGSCNRIALRMPLVTAIPFRRRRCSAKPRHSTSSDCGAFKGRIFTANRSRPQRCDAMRCDALWFRTGGARNAWERDATIDHDEVDGLCSRQNAVAESIPQQCSAK